ncbi:uncharacterized protein LOC125179445 [Hyalella azteca]|uniref:Uncharacterized protein LOC125179445 n=1 Tax=Hyalella azteca TaxID=294128 RepID=A0A979FX91_HYAAZ|nr:uncharacterized protein LOC125179445 [Hyalella azteca]
MDLSKEASGRKWRGIAKKGKRRDVGLLQPSSSTQPETLEPYMPALSKRQSTSIAPPHHHHNAASQNLDTKPNSTITPTTKPELLNCASNAKNCRRSSSPIPKKTGSKSIGNFIRVGGNTTVSSKKTKLHPPIDQELQEKLSSKVKSSDFESRSDRLSKNTKSKKYPFKHSKDSKHYSDREGEENINYWCDKNLNVQNDNNFHEDFIEKSHKSLPTLSDEKESASPTQSQKKNKKKCGFMRPAHLQKKNHCSSTSSHHSGDEVKSCTNSFEVTTKSLVKENQSSKKNLQTQSKSLLPATERMNRSHSNLQMHTRKSVSSENNGSDARNLNLSSECIGVGISSDHSNSDLKNQSLEKADSVKGCTKNEAQLTGNNKNPEKKRRKSRNAKETCKNSRNLPSASSNQDKKPFFNENARRSHSPPVESVHLNCSRVNEERNYSSDLAKNGPCVDFEKFDEKSNNSLLQETNEKLTEAPNCRRNNHRKHHRNRGVDGYAVNNVDESVESSLSTAELNKESVALNSNNQFEVKGSVENTNLGEDDRRQVKKHKPQSVHTENRDIRTRRSVASGESFVVGVIEDSVPNLLDSTKKMRCLRSHSLSVQQKKLTDHSELSESSYDKRIPPCMSGSTDESVVISEKDNSEDIKINNQAVKAKESWDNCEKFTEKLIDVNLAPGSESLDASEKPVPIDVHNSVLNVNHSTDILERSNDRDSADDTPHVAASSSTSKAEGSELSKSSYVSPNVENDVERPSSRKRLQLDRSSFNKSEKAKAAVEALLGESPQKSPLKSSSIASNISVATSSSEPLVSVSNKLLECKPSLEDSAPASKLGLSPSPLQKASVETLLEVLPSDAMHRIPNTSLDIDPRPSLSADNEPTSPLSSKSFPETAAKADSPEMPLDRKVIDVPSSPGRRITTQEAEVAGIGPALFYDQACDDNSSSNNDLSLDQVPFDSRASVTDTNCGHVSGVNRDRERLVCMSADDTGTSEKLQKVEISHENKDENSSLGNHHPSEKMQGSSSLNLACSSELGKSLTSSVQPSNEMEEKKTDSLVVDVDAKTIPDNSKKSDQVIPCLQHQELISSHTAEGNGFHRENSAPPIELRGVKKTTKKRRNSIETSSPEKNLRRSSLRSRRNSLQTFTAAPHVLPGSLLKNNSRQETSKDLVVTRLADVQTTDECDRGELSTCEEKSRNENEASEKLDGSPDTVVAFSITSENAAGCEASSVPLNTTDASKDTQVIQDDGLQRIEDLDAELASASLERRAAIPKIEDSNTDLACTSSESNIISNCDASGIASELNEDNDDEACARVLRGRIIEPKRSETAKISSKAKLSFNDALDSAELIEHPSVETKPTSTKMAPNTKQMRVSSSYLAHKRSKDPRTKYRIPSRTECLIVHPPPYRLPVIVTDDRKAVKMKNRTARNQLVKVVNLERRDVLETAYLGDGKVMRYPLRKVKASESQPAELQEDAVEVKNLVAKDDSAHAGTILKSSNTISETGELGDLSCPNETLSCDVVLSTSKIVSKTPTIPPITKNVGTNSEGGDASKSVAEADSSISNLQDNREDETAKQGRKKRQPKASQKLIESLESGSLDLFNMSKLLVDKPVLEMHDTKKAKDASQQEISEATTADKVAPDQEQTTSAVADGINSKSASQKSATVRKKRPLDDSIPTNTKKRKKEDRKTFSCCEINFENAFDLQRHMVKKAMEGDAEHSEKLQSQGYNKCKRCPAWIRDSMMAIHLQNIHNDSSNSTSKLEIQTMVIKLKKQSVPVKLSTETTQNKSDLSARKNFSSKQKPFVDLGPRISVSDNNYLSDDTENRATENTSKKPVLKSILIKKSQSVNKTKNKKSVTLFSQDDLDNDSENNCEDNPASTVTSYSPSSSSSDDETSHHQKPGYKKKKSKKTSGTIDSFDDRDNYKPYSKKARAFNPLSDDSFIGHTENTRAQIKTKSSLRSSRKSFPEKPNSSKVKGKDPEDHSSSSSDDENSDYSTDDSYNSVDEYSDSSYDAERENAPLVELQLFSFATDDLAVLLMDPKNPKLKVFATMGSIFVSDVSLEPEKKPMSYLTENNNVIYVSHHHNVFPNVKDIMHFIPKPVVVMKMTRMEANAIKRNSSNMAGNILKESNNTSSNQVSSSHNRVAELLSEILSKSVKSCEPNRVDKTDFATVKNYLVEKQSSGKTESESPRVRPVKPSRRKKDEKLQVLSGNLQQPLSSSSPLPQSVKCPVYVESHNKSSNLDMTGLSPVKIPVEHSGQKIRSPFAKGDADLLQQLVSSTIHSPCEVENWDDSQNNQYGPILTYDAESSITVSADEMVLQANENENEHIADTNSVSSPLSSRRRNNHQNYFTEVCEVEYQEISQRVSEHEVIGVPMSSETDCETRSVINATDSSAVSKPAGKNQNLKWSFLDEDSDEFLNTLEFTDTLQSPTRFDSSDGNESNEGRLRNISGLSKQSSKRSGLVIGQDSSCNTANASNEKTFLESTSEAGPHDSLELKSDKHSKKQRYGQIRSKLADDVSIKENVLQTPVHDVRPRPTFISPPCRKRLQCFDETEGSPNRLYSKLAYSTLSDNDIFGLWPEGASPKANKVSNNNNRRRKKSRSSSTESFSLNQAGRLHRYSLKSDKLASGNAVTSDSAAETSEDESRLCFNTSTLTGKVPVKSPDAANNSEHSLSLRFTSPSPSGSASVAAKTRSSLKRQKSPDVSKYSPVPSDILTPKSSKIKLAVSFDDGSVPLEFSVDSIRSNDFSPRSMANLPDENALLSNRTSPLPCSPTAAPAVLPFFANEDDLGCISDTESQFRGVKKSKKRKEKKYKSKKKKKEKHRHHSSSHNVENRHENHGIKMKINLIGMTSEMMSPISASPDRGSASSRIFDTLIEDSKNYPESNFDCPFTEVPQSSNVLITSASDSPLPCRTPLYPEPCTIDSADFSETTSSAAEDLVVSNDDLQAVAENDSLLPVVDLLVNNNASSADVLDSKKSHSQPLSSSCIPSPNAKKQHSKSDKDLFKIRGRIGSESDEEPNATGQRNLKTDDGEIETSERSPVVTEEREESMTCTSVEKAILSPRPWIGRDAKVRAAVLIHDLQDGITNSTVPASGTLHDAAITFSTSPHSEVKRNSSTQDSTNYNEKESPDTFHAKKSRINQDLSLNEEDSTKVGQLHSTPIERRPVADAVPTSEDRAWHSRDAKLKAQILISDQQCGIVNSSVLTAQTPISTSSTNASAFSPSDIRNFFQPTKKEVVSDTPVSVKPVKISRPQPDIRSFLLPNTACVDAESPAVSSNIPLVEATIPITNTGKKKPRKRSRRVPEKSELEPVHKYPRPMSPAYGASIPVHNLKSWYESRCSRLAVIAGEMPSGPANFVGFDSLEPYSGARAQTLRHIITLSNMKKWNQQSRPYPMPVDQIYDWDEDEVMLSLDL